MLKLLRQISFLFLLCLVTSQVAGQNSASASFTASVRIIEPVEINTVSNMNFANIDARTGGTVTLNPDNTRTVNGDVQLNTADQISAAEFEIKGQHGRAYDLQIPQGDFIMSNGTSEIKLKDFKISQLPEELSTSTQKIRMGATIEIEPNQEPGQYITPTSLEITISYN